MTDERSERLRRRRHRRQQRVADLDEAAAGWACGIESCSYTGETVTDLIAHQTYDHPPHTCKVCGRDVPAGFFAIYHSFEEHARAEFVKAYGATPDDIRQREQVIALVEREIDVPALRQRIGQEHRPPNP